MFCKYRTSNSILLPVEIDSGDWNSSSVNSFKESTCFLRPWSTNDYIIIYPIPHSNESVMTILWCKVWSSRKYGLHHWKPGAGFSEAEGANPSFIPVDISGSDSKNWGY